MNLNKEDSLQLIQEYQKHRMLWDPTDKWYFHKIKKNDAWDEVATALNIDVEDAKKKISSLLGSFRREKAKARKTMGTGKGAKDIYRSDWFAFNSFAFLMEKDDPRQTISSEKINDSETTDDSEISEVESEVHLHQETPAFPELGENIEQTLEPPAPGTSKRKKSIEVTQVTDNTQEASTSKSFVKPSTPKRKRAKTTEKEDPRIEKAFQFLQQPIPPDESSLIFAKYVADRLNTFDHRTKAILVHKINQLIFDAEMEKYNTSSPGSLYSHESTRSPFSNEVLDSNDGHANTQSSVSHTTSEAVAAELQDFVYFTTL
ncbi:uncharacterized protein [Leptinotarsa decemlineata]|uniref:uncharacterized protein n=1 Tax=Leptinotarsa decemlineata TaxID=7539 RepID=UPI003D30AAEA